MADYFPRMSIFATKRRAALLWPAMTMSMLSSFACADGLPASVRACTATTNPDQRLACFDREVARFQNAPVQVEVRRNTDQIDSLHPGSISAAAPGPAESPRSGSSGGQQKNTDDSAQNEPRRVKARIVSVKNSSDDIVVHLDNGQIWEQIQEASGSMNLRAGDTVSIERSMGSYWLSGRSQMVMKVKRKE